jgi:hypothetical protein
VAATVAQLGARTLRKLGVAIVANAGRPSDGPTMTASEVAGLAVRQLGIVVPESDRPAITVTVTPDDMAARALRAVGINPAVLGALPTGGVSTKAALATRVLSKLGVIASDETPEPSDLADAETKVAAVHDMLVTLGYATWTVDAVPDHAAEWVITMSANLLAPEFGKPGSAEAFNIGREAIREMALTGAYGQSLALAKVAAVHDELVSAGLVSWPLTAVPQSQAENYVTMAATLLAPVMGRPQTPPDRQADQAAWDAAEGRIKRASMIAGVQDRAIARVREVYGELNALGLVSYDINTIPSAVSDAMAGLAAATLGPDFGKDEAPDALAARWMRIKQVAMAGPAGQALAEQEVRSAFQSLEARGRVRDSIYAMPPWLEDPVTSLAAASLAPQLGLKSDPTWVPKAELELMQIHSLPTNYGTVKAQYF